MKYANSLARLGAILILTFSLLSSNPIWPGYTWRSIVKSSSAAKTKTALPVNSTPKLAEADPATNARVSEAYSKLPLSFEANHGQTDPSVKFISRGQGYHLYLTGTEAVLALRKSAAHSKDPRMPRKNATQGSAQSSEATQAVLRMKFLGANTNSPVEGLEELPGQSNYFIGHDPKQWHTGVTRYTKVKYREVYPGIDIIYYGNQSQLEYDLVVAPGADPHRIKLAFEGDRQMRVDAEGGLVMETAVGVVRQPEPTIYQEANGVKSLVSGHYVQTGEREVGFELGAYDRSQPLVIDPVIAYSTYLGGNQGDFGEAIYVDTLGNTYVSGYTSSPDFPIKNAAQSNYGSGDIDVFVTELNPTGTTLIFSTYLGGSGVDYPGFSLALDAVGNIYVTGYTNSADFPIKQAFQPVLNDGGQGFGDAFLTELNPQGSVIIFSTYLGGSDDEGANGVALDVAGNAYVMGQTNSTDFPTKNALQPTYGGGVQNEFAAGDTFVSKFTPAGDALIYSTYLGGSDDDGGYDLAVDAAGNAYVAGITYSSDFPTAHAFQPNLRGESDAFLAKLNPSGSALVYSTYLGGSGDEIAFGVAVDAEGHAYVTGGTGSDDFPTKNALQIIRGGGSSDAYVAKITPAGDALIFSTFLGGSESDTATGLAVDAAGHVSVTGYTYSLDLPVVNAIQAHHANLDPTGEGAADAFVAKLNAAGSALTSSTYLGGSGDDQGQQIAVDRVGNAYVTGFTNSDNFLTSPGAFQRAGTGDYDAFIIKLAETPECERICFLSPDFFGLHANHVPKTLVLIGGVNFNTPISTTNQVVIGLALRGGRSPLAQLNRGFVAAQLSVELAGTAALSARHRPLSCSGLIFLPVILSDGFVLTADSPLEDLFTQARKAIRENRAADQLALARLFERLNSNNPFRGCGPAVTGQR